MAKSPSRWPLLSTAAPPNHTKCDNWRGSNVYVTGRTSTPNYPAFCGQDASTYWRSNEFPDLGYTVCWRWR